MPGPTTPGGEAPGPRWNPPQRRGSAPDPRDPVGSPHPADRARGPGRPRHRIAAPSRGRRIDMAIAHAPPVRAARPVGSWPTRLTPMASSGSTTPIRRDAARRAPPDAASARPLRSPAAAGSCRAWPVCAARHVVGHPYGPRSLALRSASPRAPSRPIPARHQAVAIRRVARARRDQPPRARKNGRRAARPPAPRRHTARTEHEKRPGRVSGDRSTVPTPESRERAPNGRFT